MKEGSLISEKIVKLVEYVGRLASLEFRIPPTVGTDIALASLPHLTMLYHELQHEQD